MFTQVIIWKQKTDVRLMDIRLTNGWTDGHTDVQCKTITPRHYHVRGIKSKGPEQPAYLHILVRTFHSLVINRQQEDNLFSTLEAQPSTSRSLWTSAILWKMDTTSGEAILKQEAYGPRFAHLSDIATADMQMFPIIYAKIQP